MRHRSVVLWIAFRLLQNVAPVHSFASWLKCYIDLDDTEEIVMNSFIQSFEDAEYKASVVVRRSGEEDWQTSLQYSAGAHTTIEARLELPPELHGRDLQWVMETTEGGKFTASAMCDGKRSYAQKPKEITILEIDSTKEYVDLFAGWATGHEAVKLTGRTRLLREGTTGEL